MCGFTEEKAVANILERCYWAHTKKDDCAISVTPVAVSWLELPATAGLPPAFSGAFLAIEQSAAHFIESFWGVIAIQPLLEH